jgi:hypothetical protein
VGLPPRAGGRRVLDRQAALVAHPGAESELPRAGRQRVLRVGVPAQAARHPRRVHRHVARLPGLRQRPRRVRLRAGGVLGDRAGTGHVRQRARRAVPRAVLGGARRTRDGRRRAPRAGPPLGAGGPRLRRRGLRDARTPTRSRSAAIATAKARRATGPATA